MSQTEYKIETKLDDATGCLTMPSSQIDSIFKALGPTGQFTIRQLMCLFLGTFPGTFQLLSNVFIGRTVQSQCSLPSNYSSLMANRYADYENLTVETTECELVIRSNASVIDRTPCLYGYDYDQPRDMSVMSEFDLVCSKSPLFHLSQTLVIAGQGLGAIVATIIADRFGRKLVTVGANFGLLASGLAVAFAPNYIVFAFGKLLTGAFQQAYLSGSMTLFLEMLTTKDRRWSTATEGMKWISGVMVLDLLAFLLRHHPWRTLQITLSLSSLPAFFQLWYVQESLRWLSANNKTEEVKKCITYAAKVNGKTYKEIVEMCGEISNVTRSLNNGGLDEVRGNDEDLKQIETNSLQYTTTTTTKLTFFDIFRIRSLLISSLVMWCVWFTVVLGFFALYLISTPIVGNFHLNFFLTAVMEIPAQVFLFLSLNRLGRKKTFVALLSILSFGLIASGALRSLEESPETSIAALVGSLIAVFGASGSFRIVFSYTLELFPTNIRNQALGIASLMGRVGGMTAPFMNVISQRAKWAPGILIGCLSFIVAFLLRLLPETTGRELPQTIEDVHQWKNEKKYSNGNVKPLTQTKNEVNQWTKEKK